MISPGAHPRSETDLGDVSQSARGDHTRSPEQAVNSTADLKSEIAFPPISRLHTVPEVAAVVNVSTRAVRRLITDEELAPRLPRLLTVPEVAEILHLSPRTVWRMVHDGRLSVVRFGRAVRIRLDVLTACIEE